MRLFEKGEVSFIFLWILNPIVILFYQNCTPNHLTVRERTEVRTSDQISSMSSGRSPASADNVPSKKILPYHHSFRR